MVTAPKSYRYLYMCAGTAALGMFQFGYHLGELNTISDILRCAGGTALDGPYPSFLGLPPCVPMSVLQFSFINAMIALAGMFGAVWTGLAVDRYGRRRTMQLLNIPLVMSPFLLGFSVNYAMLVLGRMVGGFGTGGVVVVVPIYLSEISPSAKRGMIGIFSTVALSSGLAIAGLLGYFLSNPPFWRIIVGFSIIVAAIQITLLPFVVESPVYLSRQGRRADAATVNRAMGASEEAIAEHTRPGATETRTEEVPMMEQSATSAAAEDTAQRAPTVLQFLMRPEYRPSLLVLVVEHMAQQLSGINSLFASAFQILMLVMSSVEGARLFNVFFAFYYVLLSAVPGFLLERYGRRPLLILSSFGMSFFSLVFFLGSQFNVPILALVGFVLAVTFFSFGLSPIPFIMTAEVVEPAAVGVASRIALVVNTGSNFIVLFAVPPLLALIQGYVFIFFAAFLALVGFIQYRIVPETKGKSAHMVVAELRAKFGVAASEDPEKYASVPATGSKEENKDASPSA